MGEEEGGLDVDPALDGMFALESPVCLCGRIALALRGGHVSEGAASGVGGLVELAHHSNKIILYRPFGEVSG